jgi:predicted RNase H-like HicB family nuclease
MKNSYKFVAIFDYADDGISIEFPDLPGCLSCGDNTDEALKNAEEVLGLWLYSMEEDNEPIPEPTPIEKVKHEPNQILFLIEVWMPLVRNEIESYAVKKTLTIPQWLNKIAEDKKVNFSQVLQAALKEYLGIQNHKA